MRSCVVRMFGPWCQTTSSSSREVPAFSRNFIAVDPRKASTGDLLSRLKSVKNIRDLSEACSSVAPGRIFRSACPVGAVPEDIQTLLSPLNIKRMIDLRSDYERAQDPSQAEGLLSQAVILRSTRSGNQVVTQVAASNRERSDDDVAKEDSDELRVELLSLLERDRYYKSMLLRLPYATTASILFWNLFNQSWAKVLAIREINKAGLSGLYQTILETAGPEIKRALEVITEAAEEQLPLLFFCKVGKDRTGMLAALVLACCGASKEEIISDYARSDGVDQVALGGMEKDRELKELDVALFSRAPAEAMQDTLDHFQQRYGGMLGYLDSIGFDRDSQKRLARSLAEEPTSNGA